ncbi:hypothetical protein BH09MYX1_BH09MYX1_13180 [soil metagenome]
MRPTVFVLSSAFVLAACDHKDTAEATAKATATVEAKLDDDVPAKGIGGRGAPGGQGQGARPLERFDVAEIVVPPGTSMLHIAWDIPKGTGVNDDAPVTVRFLESDGLIVAPTDLSGHGKDFAHGFDVPLEISGNTTAAKLAGDVELVVCDVETHSVCVPLKRRLEVTFGVQKGAAPGMVRVPLPQAKRG